GRVLDPAPLAALVAEIQTAEAAVAATQKEFERVKRLHEQGENASARAVEMAEAAFRRDRVAVDAVRLRLMAAWGEGVASHQDLPAAVRSLAKLDAALLRVDLPAGESIKSAPTAVRVATLTTDAPLIEAKLLGPATSVDPQAQGQGFLALVKPNPQRLAPGAAVTAWLSLSGEPIKGVLVPRAAVLRSDGRTWVYVQAGEDTFTRREIFLERPTDVGWLVTRGLAPNNTVVVTGGQALLSEELKALTPKGD
ncbi:MAG TPA: hypothetical protein VI454_09550, partial [Verrucomicrobiae bacterium]